MFLYSFEMPRTSNTGKKKVPYFELRYKANHNDTWPECLLRLTL